VPSSRAGARSPPAYTTGQAELFQIQEGSAELPSCSCGRAPLDQLRLNPSGGPQARATAADPQRKALFDGLATLPGAQKAGIEGVPGSDCVGDLQVLSHLVGDAG